MAFLSNSDEIILQMISDFKNENYIFVAGYCRFAQNHISLKNFPDVAELRLEKVTVRLLEIKFFRSREILFAESKKYK